MTTWTHINRVRLGLCWLSAGTMSWMLLLLLVGCYKGEKGENFLSDCVIPAWGQRPAGEVRNAFAPVKLPAWVKHWTHGCGTPPQLIPCIFNPRNTLPCSGVVRAAGEMLLCIHSPLQPLGSSQEAGGTLEHCQAAELLQTACPMGHIFCLFDLPLTFAVTAGKADPIDFMWIMIFCRLLWNLLIVHTAIYSVSEWESENFWWCKRLSAHTIVDLTLLYFLLSDGTRHCKIDILCPVWKVSEIFCLLSKEKTGMLTAVLISWVIQWWPHHLYWLSAAWLKCSY